MDPLPPNQAANQPPAPPPVAQLNPYQPAMAGAPNPALPKIFNARSVGIATFFGSGLAGTVLMYLTLSRLGLQREARRAVGLGALITLLTLGAALVLPQGVGNVAPLAATFGMLALAHKLLDAPVAAHLARGGGRASGWHTAGVSLGGAVATLGVVIFATLAFDGVGEKFVEVSPEHRVVYERKATEADAKAVGEVLKARGVFVAGQPGEVIIGGTKQALNVQVVLTSGWRDPQTVVFFTEVAQDLGKATGKRFVKLELCDDFLNVKQKISTANAS